MSNFAIPFPSYYETMIQYFNFLVRSALPSLICLLGAHICPPLSLSCDSSRLRVFFCAAHWTQQFDFVPVPPVLHSFSQLTALSKQWSNVACVTSIDFYTKASAQRSRSIWLNALACCSHAQVVVVTIIPLALLVAVGIFVFLPMWLVDMRDMSDSDE